MGAPTARRRRDIRQARRRVANRRGWIVGLNGVRVIAVNRALRRVDTGARADLGVGVAETIGIGQHVPQLIGTIDALRNRAQRVAGLRYRLAAASVIGAPPRQASDLRHGVKAVGERALEPFAKLGELLPVGLHQPEAGWATHALLHEDAGAVQRTFATIDDLAIHVVGVVPHAVIDAAVLQPRGFALRHQAPERVVAEHVGRCLVVAVRAAAGNALLDPALAGLIERGVGVGVLRGDVTAGRQPSRDVAAPAVVGTGLELEYRYVGGLPSTCVVGVLQPGHITSAIAEQRLLHRDATVTVVGISLRAGDLATG